MEVFAQTIVSGLLLGAVLGLIAVGLTLIFGVVDIVNFAHGEFLMVGMYIAFFAWRLWGVDPLFSIPLAALGVGILGVISYLTFVRHAMRGTLLSQIFVTFGLLIFLRGLAQALFSSNFRGVQGSILGDVGLSVGGVSVPGPQLAAAVGSLIATSAIGWFVWRTRMGKALMATSQDREAAAMLGINPHRMFALAWFIGGIATGVAAALIVSYQPVHPNSGIAYGLPAFMIVALGGFGSIGGALAAAFLVGLIENIAGFYLPTEYKELWIFVLFLIVVIARPQGLLGRR
ncbi:MAG: branched-chain amino acid ABC transporter permease [Actinobacteria bacterium]|jgi:branched-chain amino acid transport system permease protein|nr:branched-chain amino acid ABC transporter permease [Actinomycetota bacterium]MDQ3533460.1 branched-chain amino acid ABC transporter permease [Actinomycetota bacterium]